MQGLGGWCGAKVTPVSLRPWRASAPWCNAFGCVLRPRGQTEIVRGGTEENGQHLRLPGVGLVLGSLRAGWTVRPPHHQGQMRCTRLSPRVMFNPLLDTADIGTVHGCVLHIQRRAEAAERQSRPRRWQYSTRSADGKTAARGRSAVRRVVAFRGRRLRCPERGGLLRFRCLCAHETYPAAICHSGLCSGPFAAHLPFSLASWTLTGSDRRRWRASSFSIRRQPGGASPSVSSDSG